MEGFARKVTGNMTKHSANDVSAALCCELLAFTGTKFATIWLYGAPVFGHPFINVDLHIVFREQLGPAEWETVRQNHENLSCQMSLGMEDLDFWYILLDDARGSANLQGNLHYTLDTGTDRSSLGTELDALT